MKKLSKRLWAVVLAVIMAIAPFFSAGLTVYADDSIPVKFAYEGEAVQFIAADGKAFGMFTPQEGSTCYLNENMVEMHIVPQNSNPYVGFLWGLIENVSKDGSKQPEVDVAVNEDGSMDIVVEKELCGNALCIAPIKKAFEPGKASTESTWTTGKQYYLAIPAAEYIPEKPVLEPVKLNIENGVGKMFKPEALSISGESGDYMLHLTLGSESMDKVFIGDAADANEDDTGAIDIALADGKGTVDIPVAATTSPIALAFRSASKQEYYNRYLAIDLQTQTAVFYPGVVTLDTIDAISASAALSVKNLLATPEVVDEMIGVLEEAQDKTDATDKYCEIVFPYFKALSAEDQEKVEEAGYLTDDTGDAFKDDPRNQDGIGEKELLVVSFGTSFNDSRAEDVKAVEDALEEAYPDYSVRRAFTAQIIINHVRARDGVQIDNMKEALNRAMANGVKELVVQPTHLMSGAEYDEMCEELKGYEDAFDIIICKPLLDSDLDKTLVATGAAAQAVEDSTYESLDAMAEDGCALVFMGHGTAHPANVTYTQMQEKFEQLEFDNVFVGTVEGLPEGTAAEDILAKVQAAGYSKVILRPLMVVAGDHANNDMAGDEEDSWKSIFGAALGAENVTCQISGLGRIETIQEIYVDHVAKAKAVPVELFIENAVSMFKPEELTISGIDGDYMLHLVLGSEAMDKVFLGDAKEANEDDTGAIDIALADGKGTVDIPVSSTASAIALSFHSIKNDTYYNRYVAINLATETAVFYPGVATIDVIDVISPEAALDVAEQLSNPELVEDMIEVLEMQQVRTDASDKYCKIVKHYFEVLSLDNQAKVEEAGFLTDDTGDASLDDPRNQDKIGEKELLVVSFGTSFNDSRVLDTKAVEDALALAYPDYSVRRAFTAQIIINHVWARDGEKIDNMKEALDRAIANGVKELVVQPTHLMSGAEYDEMCEMLEKYKSAFDITICKPLLDSAADKNFVALAVADQTVADSAYESIAAMAEDKCAIVYMGHGTAHEAKATYTQMQETFAALGLKNVFVGTVEGEPEGTSAEDTLAKVQAAGYNKVILRPLMVVAGDHANNDMAGDEEDSWKSIFSAALGAENVTCQISGLGRITAIQALYAAHVAQKVLKEGWNLIDGKWYFVKDGGFATGWLAYNGYWYYLDPATGAMQTGWQKVDGKWYYLYNSGAMATGWVKDNGNWYFLSNSGAMLANQWLKYKDTWYFLKGSGAMANNEWLAGYWFSANGGWYYKAIGSWRQNSKGWWFGDTYGWYAKNETVKINNVNQTFNAAGYWVPAN